MNGSPDVMIGGAKAENSTSALLTWEGGPSKTSQAYEAISGILEEAAGAIA